MSKTYIIDALRLHLKARNITYKELGQAIGLSQPSIKRLFAGGDCGLERLDLKTLIASGSLKDYTVTTDGYSWGEQHLQINDADGNMLDLVQLEDGGLHATLSNAATQTDSTTQYQANGDVVGSFTTEHQPNTLPSSDAYATVLQKVADQNSALDDQALETAEIRAVAGAQGANASNDFAYQRAA